MFSEGMHSTVIYDAPVKKKPPSETCNCLPKWCCWCCGSRKKKNLNNKKDKKKKVKHSEASKLFTHLKILRQGMKVRILDQYVVITL